MSCACSCPGVVTPANVSEMVPVSNEQLVAAAASGTTTCVATALAVPNGQIVALEPVATASDKWLQMHFRPLSVAKGSIVQAGEEMGLVGKTGFDTKSGRILTPHLHMEYIANNDRDYANGDPTNPLDPSLLPRVNVTNNVSVVRSTGLDPNGNDSHILTVTVTREDQNFDVNQFSLTGNTATRTVTWNTRGGLDPSDNDINYYDGVYEKPSAFDTTSASYDIVMYFNKSTVGSTFVSAYIKDTEGNTVWSE